MWWNKFESPDDAGDTSKDEPEHSVNFQIYFLTHGWPFSLNENRSTAHLQICPRNVWLGFRKYDHLLWLNWFAWHALKEVLSHLNFYSSRSDIRWPNMEFAYNSKTSDLIFKWQTWSWSVISPLKKNNNNNFNTQQMSSQARNTFKNAFFMTAFFLTNCSVHSVSWKD